jgi:putative DNA primase/helicase
VTAPRSRGRKIAAPPDTPEIAASLARIGWPVFPVTIYEDETGKRHKVPAVKWKAEATTDVKLVHEWFTGEHSGRWIGVYAGEAGIVTLDVDPGGDDEIRKAGHSLPDTLTYPTHRKGGRHHVYAAPEGVELTIAKGILPHVDVRSGAGLMVYYGPKLKRKTSCSVPGHPKGRVSDDNATFYCAGCDATFSTGPRLAPAPDWILVQRDAPRYNDGNDRAPDATVDVFIERLPSGKPPREIRDVIRGVDFPSGAAHDVMLDAVAALVGAGAKGAPIATLMDETRERYVGRHPDRGRDWDNAVIGSIRRFGLPPTTLPLTKDERKAIKARNDPKAIEARDDARKREFRAKKHRDGIASASDPDADRPLPGDRILEDAPLADELAKILAPRWAYASGFGIMRYDGARWHPAEDHELIEAVRKLLVEIEVDEHTAAAMRGDNRAIDKARTLLGRSRAAAVQRFVVGILAERAPVFDAHPDLLNTPTGVVDLRTGELMPHDPELFFTKITGVGYDPDADMTMWRRALEVIPERTAAYLQVRFGQAATGYRPDDDVLTIFEGAGENGKTSVLIGPRRALGDYAVTVPDRLLVGDPGDHPTTLTTLQGARLAVFEELPEGRTLNVKRLKDTVGTPEITARRMRQDDITFRATHALMGSTNYLPIVSETDHGTWRRLSIIRFRLRFVKSKAEMTGERDRLGDPRIVAYFDETPDAGVLRWMIEGARQWYANGKKMPAPSKRMERDKAAWRMDADPVLAYTEERLVRDEGFAITAADLAADFNHWLERRGHKAWSQQTINSRFGGHVSLDGIERKPVKWSLSLRPSRPSHIFGTKPIPAVTTSWRGIRFVDEPAGMQSEAERDAETLRDLERRAKL